MTFSFLFSFSPQMDFLSRLYYENRTVLALFVGVGKNTLREALD